MSHFHFKVKLLGQTLLALMQAFLLRFIKMYQTVTAWLPHRCRFYPSCSTYMKQAIERHGLFQGVLFGSQRLCRCHPFHEGGIDPVPR